MRDATKIIRSTLTPAVAGEPLHPGPVFAAPYHTPGDPADTPYTYARSHNPTWTSLEKAIGQMESGEDYVRARWSSRPAWRRARQSSERYCGRETWSCCLQTPITPPAS